MHGAQVANLALPFRLAHEVAIGTGVELPVDARGIVAGLAIRIAAPWLVKPVLTTVFDAIARHQAESTPARVEDES